MPEVAFGDRPVHVVEVQALEVQVAQGDVDALFDVFDAVARGVLVCWRFDEVGLEGGHTDRSTACW